MLSFVPTIIDMATKNSFLEQFKYVTKHDMSEPEKVKLISRNMPNTIIMTSISILSCTMHF